MLQFQEMRQIMQEHLQAMAEKIGRLCDPGFCRGELAVWRIRKKDSYFFIKICYTSILILGDCCRKNARDTIATVVKNLIKENDFCRSNRKI